MKKKTHCIWQWSTLVIYTQMKGIASPDRNELNRNIRSVKSFVFKWWLMWTGNTQLQGNEWNFAWWDVKSLAHQMTSIIVYFRHLSPPHYLASSQLFHSCAVLCLTSSSFSSLPSVLLHHIFRSHQTNYHSLMGGGREKTSIHTYIHIYVFLKEYLCM